MWHGAYPKNFLGVNAGSTGAPKIARRYCKNPSLPELWDAASSRFCRTAFKCG